MTVLRRISGKEVELEAFLKTALDEGEVLTCCFQLLKSPEKYCLLVTIIFKYFYLVSLITET
jgi:hypothetical protein